jgi:hypothetical protein
MNEEQKNISTDDNAEWGFWKKLTRRRHYLIDKNLQINFTILLIMIGVINAVFFGFIFYLFSQHIAMVYKPLLIDTVIQENVVQFKNFILWRTILFGIAFECILIILLGIFFSHRIAGPLFKISRSLREIAQGRNPGLIKLRKDDMLKNFAETVNEMIISLKDRYNLK